MALAAFVKPAKNQLKITSSDDSEYNRIKATIHVRRINDEIAHILAARQLYKDDTRNSAFNTLQALSVTIERNTSPVDVEDIVTFIQITRPTLANAAGNLSMLRLLWPIADPEQRLRIDELIEEWTIFARDVTPSSQ
jgi:hypothetical protein